MCLDRSWVVAHPAMTDEAAAASGGPIAKLGEDSIGKYLDAVPGTIQRFESVPLWFGLSMKAMKWLAPASMERTSVNIQKQTAIGRKKIEDASGIEIYDQTARRRRELFSLGELINQQSLEHDSIVFEE